MSNGAKVAVAVGAGYFLGRTRKMRLALMLAAAGITGKFPPKPGDLMAQGLKSVGGSEQLSQLGGQLRGEVLTAARGAAIAAATNRVEALNNRLQGVTSAVGADQPLADVGGSVDETVHKVGKPAQSVARLRAKSARRQPEDIDGDDLIYDDEDEPADLDEDDDEDLYETDEDEDDLDEADLDDEEDDEDQDLGADEQPQPPVRRRRATRRPAAARTSARRSTTAASQEEPVVRAARRRPTTATNRTSVRRGR